MLVRATRATPPPTRANATAAFAALVHWPVLFLFVLQRERAECVQHRVLRVVALGEWPDPLLGPPRRDLQRGQRWAASDGGWEAGARREGAPKGPERPRGMP